MSVVIQLDRFEGPLALLLYLIRKEEMNIFDINIHQITRQYLDYIKRMKNLDLEMAGEFVAMAATLIQIKSQLLMPEYNEAGEVIETSDPRKPLIQRLLEYQKYQEASRRLNERAWLFRDVWPRGIREDFSETKEELVVEENPLYSLILQYKFALRRAKKSVHKVASELKSIAERILEMSALFRPGERTTMGRLLQSTENKTYDILITFLSLLELAKMGLVRIFQNEVYGEIHLEAKAEIDPRMLSQVENYDAGNTEQITERLFAEGAAEDEAPSEAATDEEILAEEERLS